MIHYGSTQETSGSNPNCCLLNLSHIVSISAPFSIVCQWALTDYSVPLHSLFPYSHGSQLVWSSFTWHNTHFEFKMSTTLPLNLILRSFQSIIRTIVCIDFWNWLHQISGSLTYLLQCAIHQTYVQCEDSFVSKTLVSVHVCLLPTCGLWGLGCTGTPVLSSDLPVPWHCCLPHL